MTILIVRSSSLSHSSLRSSSLALRCKSTRMEASSSSSSSLLYSAADLFAALRWKAATALTQSLKDDERDQLLRMYNYQPPPPPQPQKSNEATTTGTGKTSKSTRDADHPSSTPPVSVSIQEAVAAAVLKEQQRLATVKDEAIAQAVAQAEQAAQARVQAELAVMQHRRQAFDAWQESVNREKAKSNSNSDKSNSSTSSISASSSSPSEEEEKEQVHEQKVQEHHPILGPCLADLGTKRIHLVSASALASIPVWNQQRVYRHDRAKVMAADKLKTAHLGMLGVIALHQDYHTGSLSILDGQHRVGMMTILEQKHGLQLDPVLVEVYTQQEQPQQENENNAVDATVSVDNNPDQLLAREIFEEINKAEPVKLVDMPGMIKAADRKTLNGGVERIYEKFRDMFSTSSRCRAPHVHMDNLRDALFAANVLERHQIKTAKALEEWMLQQNEILRVKYSNSSSSSSPSPEEEAATNNNTTTTTTTATTTNVAKQALAKAHKYGFYLGLETTWYHN